MFRGVGIRVDDRRKARVVNLAVVIVIFANRPGVGSLPTFVANENIGRSVGVFDLHLEEQTRQTVVNALVDARRVKPPVAERYADFNFVGADRFRRFKNVGRVVSNVRNAFIVIGKHRPANLIAEFRAVQVTLRVTEPRHKDDRALDFDALSQFVNAGKITRRNRKLRRGRLVFLPRLRVASGQNKGVAPIRIVEIGRDVTFVETFDRLPTFVGNVIRLFTGFIAKIKRAEEPARVRGAADVVNFNNKNVLAVSQKRRHIASRGETVLVGTS